MFCSKCGKQNPDDAVFCISCGTKVGEQNQTQEQGGNNQTFTPPSSVALNSMPPSAVDPAGIAMFKIKNMGIAMELDGIWGEKVFSYLVHQDMQDDYNKLLEALRQITKNMVMQFNSEGSPVVPLYRIKHINASDWWGPSRLELDIEGAGKQWIPYTNKNTRDADHVVLGNMMRGGQQL